MHHSIALIATWDTKGEDGAFLAECLRRRGHQVIRIDTSTSGDHQSPCEIGPAAVAAAAGVAWSARETGNRDGVISAMGAGAAAIVRQLQIEGRIDGVLGIGGGTGTAMGTAAMRGLPFGFPKVMISTMAGCTNGNYLGGSDLVMIPSIVDICGINRVSARTYSQAVGALIGMIESRTELLQLRPQVAASMFGNTTLCVTAAQRVLGQAGYDMLVFHANGTGGRNLEAMISHGEFTGVLDVTTTEIGNELLGGVLSAGPDRLSAAGRHGVPQVVVPGCMDMVNFWEPHTVPNRYAMRHLYAWNRHVTLMRTDLEENRRIGSEFADRLNRATGPAAVFLPLRGVSHLDQSGGPFWWPEADQMLFTTIRQGLHRQIEVHEVDAHINDAIFAERIAVHLLRSMTPLSKENPCRFTNASR